MDEDIEEGEGWTMAPQRFSRVTLVRVGLDFLGHVAEGAACAIRQLEHAVLGHELRMMEERNWQDELSYALETIDETGDDS